MTEVLKAAGVALPEVSIVVIAFNERERAPESVASILAQLGEASFEVVVVDDGSVDGMSPSLLSRFGDEPRLSVVRLPSNRGRGAARATGVAFARGRFIGFVDADIVLPATWLSRCLASIDGHSAVGGIAVPDGDCAVLYRLFRLEPKELVGSVGVTGNNVLFDGESLRSIGFDPDSRLGEDFRLAKRMQGAGLSTAIVPGLAVEHRESKSYPQEARWLFDSGRDATRLLAEFGDVRLPDIAWAVWLATTSVLIVKSPPRRWVLAAAAPAAVIALAHMQTRFSFKASPVRWSIAWLADIPLMETYLIGRTWSVPSVVRTLLMARLRRDGASGAASS